MTRSKKGLTLLELLVAITLLTTVILTASTLLISFKKFYFDFIQRQSDIGEVTLAVLEEMVNRVTVANNVSITGSSRIAIRVDNTDPSDPDDDTIHTYWKTGDTIKYKSKVGSNPEGPARTIAQNIGLLNFELQPGGDPVLNWVKIAIGILPPGGGEQQDFETTVVTRARSTQ